MITINDDKKENKGMPFSPHDFIPTVLIFLNFLMLLYGGP